MRERGSTPVKDRRETRYDDVEDKNSSKHRSKERSKGSQKDDVDHRSGDRSRHKERERETDRRKDDRDDREKDRKRREKEDEREKDHVKERDRDRGDKDRVREKSGTREKEREREKEHDKEKGKDKHKDRERVSDKDRHRHSVERHREKEGDQDNGRSRERDRGGRKHRDEGHDKSKEERMDDIMTEEREEGEVVDTKEYVMKRSSRDEVDNRSRRHEEKAHGKSTEINLSASELEGRISKMKKERLHKQPEGNSDILSWVSKSRKLEEKTAKEKALRLSKVFEEQDDILQEDFEIDRAAKHSSRDLAGVKVLHGLDKVLEGGAVVLTLKDQSILADGDLNEEADVLENVEIGEQKRRNEAYQAAKKKPGTFEDKFNDEPGFEKKMLPQYDDPAADEGITLDATGRFTGEAGMKLEELRKRIQGIPTNNHFEDMSSTDKIVSDYYTPEEMLKFKKPKKKKSLRKKDKLDLDALEAEALSAGLGDLGSRRNSNREAINEEREKKEAEMRNHAYQVAYSKADELSKTLKIEQSQKEEDESSILYGDDDEELRKSLARARKVALRKQDESGTSSSGPEAISRLAASDSMAVDDQNLTSNGEIMQENNKVVFTEMEEFVGGLQLDEEAHKPDSEDVFMEDDLAPNSSDQEMEDIEDGGWTEVKNSDNDELLPLNADEPERGMVPDDTIHEAPVGKGLSATLKMLKDRGTLKDTVEWGGRNMDKKKSKLQGIHEHVDGEREIRLERTDEYGRVLTPKEAFRLLSHKFHGKGPGKMKQEKRMRQYEEELKIKKMKNSDTPSQSVERMRDAQAQLKTPYLVLSGNIKPGQTSDPTSGFATVERNAPGSLTPMLGDRKVEHFLGLRRKPGSGNMGPPPPRKPGPKPQSKLGDKPDI